MNLTIRFLGMELLHLALSTDAETNDDPGYSLSGGYLASAPMDDGPSDRYMGFTNGRGE